MGKCSITVCSNSHSAQTLPMVREFPHAFYIPFSDYKTKNKMKLPLMAFSIYVSLSLSPLYGGERKRINISSWVSISHKFRRLALLLLNGKRGKSQQVSTPRHSLHSSIASHSTTSPWLPRDYWLRRSCLTAFEMSRFRLCSVCISGNWIIHESI